jgi:hypothetical protein
MFDYDGHILAGVTASHPTWRTGMGPDVPSKWGNEQIALNSTTYPGLNEMEHFAPLVVHVFTDSTGRTKATVGYPNTNTLPPEPGYTLTCSYAAVIATTDGGIANLGGC